MTVKIPIGPDDNVFLIVWEVGGHMTQAISRADRPTPNWPRGVLRITQDGKIVNPENPIFGEELPLNLYYAMGIRNSIGMDCDPLTGYLWDTENGPTAGDKIHMVFQGFDSGCYSIQRYLDDELMERDSEDGLVYFGNSQYADPYLCGQYPSV